jgi:hypothetical protein
MSVPAACFPQVETDSWRKPSVPFAIRIARSVHSFGGVFTFAFPAAYTAGTARSRAVIDFSRSAAGAKSRLSSASMPSPGMRE